MFRAISIAVFTLFANCALAAACHPGTNTVLRLDSWSVESDDLGPKVTLNFTNIGGRAFRIIRAMARFYDAAGVDIGYADIDMDLHAEIGETFSQTERGSARMDRLPFVAKAEISAAICVTDVIYVDGSSRTFR